MKRLLYILPILLLGSCSQFFDDYNIMVRNSSGAAITCVINGTTYTVNDGEFSAYQYFSVDPDESLTVTINGSEAFDLGADQPAEFILSIYKSGTDYAYYIDEPLDSYLEMTVDGSEIRFDSASLLGETSGKYATSFFQNRDDELRNKTDFTIPGAPQTGTTYNYTLCQSSFFSYTISYPNNIYTVASDSDFALVFTTVDNIRGTYTATFSGTLSQTGQDPISVTNGFVTGYFGK